MNPNNTTYGLVDVCVGRLNWSTCRSGGHTEKIKKIVNLQGLLNW